MYVVYAVYAVCVPVCMYGGIQAHMEELNLAERQLGVEEQERLDRHNMQMEGLKLNNKAAEDSIRLKGLEKESSIINANADREHKRKMGFYNLQLQGKVTLMATASENNQTQIIDDRYSGSRQVFV